MPRLTAKTPAYRLHRASGQALVTIAGNDNYLGPWKSRASRIEYDPLVGEWLASGQPIMPCSRDCGDYRHGSRRRVWEVRQATLCQTWSREKHPGRLVVRVESPGQIGWVCRWWTWLGFERHGGFH